MGGYGTDHEAWALDELRHGGSSFTVSGLFDRVDRVDRVSVLPEKILPRNTFSLDSRISADGLSHAPIIQGMPRNGDDIRVIGQTETAKFLRWEMSSPHFCRFGSFAIWIHAEAGKTQIPTLSTHNLYKRSV